jgi:enamine deaminase RidA (YjgF/YER057c/UK114 family)
MIEERLRELGLTLPPPLQMPAATRTPAVQVGPLLYLSGHGCARKGKVGREVTQDEGYADAREVALKMIATVRWAIGDLDRVHRVVKVFGMVNADPSFEHHNLVINGASDLFCEVFGPEIGQHARSSLGVAGLVGNQTVEIEAILHVREGN